MKKCYSDNRACLRDVLSRPPRRRPQRHPALGGTCDPHHIDCLGAQSTEGKARLQWALIEAYTSTPILFWLFWKTIHEICSQLIDPVFNALKTCRNPQDRERSFSSLKSPFMDFREKRSEQREPNRLLRMQDPFLSSFSKEKGRCCSCRPVADAHSLISPPPSRPSGRSSSPSASRSCARGQPWSSHAWRPSPPSIVSRGPSQPWRGGSVKRLTPKFDIQGHFGCFIRTCSTRARLCLKVLPLAAWYSSW